MHIPTFDDVKIILFPKNKWHKVYGCGVVFCSTLTVSHFGLELWYQKLTLAIMVLIALNIWYLVCDFQERLLRLWYFWPFPIMPFVTVVIVFYVIPTMHVKPPNDLLVVIANFEHIPSDDKDAKAHSETVPAELERMLMGKRDSGVPLEYPIRLKHVIEGETEEEKKKKAREIGIRKGAHIVTWGSVQFIEIGGKEEFYLEPKITIVQPLGSTELEKRQPGELRASLSNPEILELRRRKIEETADIVSLIHGLALYKQGDYQNAINIFKGIKEADPENHLFHGMALTLLRRFEEALEQFGKAIEKKPEYTIASLRKGIVLYNLGKYEEAIKCYEEAVMHFDKAIKKDSKDAEAWNGKGSALYNLGRHNEAIICFDKTIEINPQFATAWNHKGIALQNLGRYDEAITCYNKAIKINSQFVLALVNKGIALVNLGNHKKAIKCFDKVIEANPQFATAWNYKGIALADLGKFIEAVECFDKTIEIDPKYALAWNGKGAALVNLGKSIEAIRYFDKATEIDPKYALAWNNKGYALQGLGKDDEAIKCYDKAIEIDPELTLARNNRDFLMRKVLSGMRPLQRIK